MADQPARALIVYGDGLMRSVAPRHCHLHQVAAAGSCGFLALRSQPNEYHPSGDDAQRVVGELAQFLDINDIYQKNTSAVGAATSDKMVAGDEPIPSMSERFMGMKAGMFTNSGPAAALGKQAGFSILEIQEGDPLFNDRAFPKPSVTAVRLLALLGLKEGAKTEQSNFELLLLHLSAGHQDETEKEQVCCHQVDWVDELLGALQVLAQPGTKAGSHLYLIVVLGYGPIDSLEANGFPLLTSDDKFPPELAQLVPQQSYTMKDGHVVSDIREHHPLLFACHLNAVTRRDDAKTFGYHEFQNHCGNLIILVNHFLHEVAFKLWKAPKYGA